MGKNYLLDLSFENLAKSLGDADWKESDEVVLFSLANKQEIETDEHFIETDECCFFGKRICIFTKQIKKNHYITLHKILLEKIIKQLGNQEVADDTEA